MASHAHSGDTTGSGASEIDASAARQVPRWPSCLPFLTKVSQVFWTLFGRYDALTLHHLADLLHHFRVGEGGDIANVHGVGDRRQDATHNLTGAGLGHIRHDVYVLGSGNWTNDGLNGPHHLLFHSLVG